MSVPILYLDTSVALKFVFDEPDARGWRDFMAQRRDDGYEVYSSELMAAEMRRSAFRMTGSPEVVDPVIAEVSLIAITSDIVEAAGRFRHYCRTLDAIHLATAIEIDEPELLVATADGGMARVAKALGLATAELKDHSTMWDVVSES